MILELHATLGSAGASDAVRRLADGGHVGYVRVEGVQEPLMP